MSHLETRWIGTFYVKCGTSRDRPSWTLTLMRRRRKRYIYLSIDLKLRNMLDGWTIFLKQIKSAMSSVSLNLAGIKPPEWATVVPESRWIEELLQKVRTAPLDE